MSFTSIHIHQVTRIDFTNLQEGGASVEDRGGRTNKDNRVDCNALDQVNTHLIPYILNSDYRFPSLITKLIICNNLGKLFELLTFFSLSDAILQIVNTYPYCYVFFNHLNGIFTKKLIIEKSIHKH